MASGGGYQDWNTVGWDKRGEKRAGESKTTAINRAMRSGVAVSVAKSKWLHMDGCEVTFMHLYAGISVLLLYAQSSFLISPQSSLTLARAHPTNLHGGDGGIWTVCHSMGRACTMTLQKIVLSLVSIAASNHISFPLALAHCSDPNMNAFFPKLTATFIDTTRHL